MTTPPFQQPVIHTIAAFSKQKLSNQFLIDKVLPYIFFIQEAVSLGYMPQ